MYRLEVKVPNRIGIQPVPQHDIAIHLAHAGERGEDLRRSFMDGEFQAQAKPVTCHGKS
jgi:UbiD family decarboxylase